MLEEWPSECKRVMKSSNKRGKSSEEETFKNAFMSCFITQDSDLKFINNDEEELIDSD